MTNNLTCSIDPIAGTNLSWENGGSGSGKLTHTPTTNEWSETAYYDKLPEDNVEFGEIDVKLTVSGHEKTGTCKIFFSSDEKTHPGDNQGDTPNWFYYWKQGAVPGLTDFVYGGDQGDTQGKYDDGTLKIYKAAATECSSYTVTNQNTGEVHEIGADAEGVNCAAANVKHEKTHKWITENWEEKVDNNVDWLDTDEDGIPNRKEGELGYNLDPTKSDTYNVADKLGHPPYESYGDEEFYCRMEEKDYNSDESKDWSWYGQQMDHAYTENE